MADHPALRRWRSFGRALRQALTAGNASAAVQQTRRRLAPQALAAGLGLGVVLAILLAGLWRAAGSRTNPGRAVGLGPIAPTRAMASTITWPQGQELPTFARPASPLTYLDLTNASNDDKALFASLQGLVNRVRPRLYIGDGAPEGDTTWANSLHLAYTRTMARAVLRAYARHATGLVVWDSSQPDTLNLATTIAGLRGALVASPAQLPLLTAPPYRLPVLEDLRGRFSSRLAIYHYAYTALWPRTTHKLLVGLNPATQFDDLRDYAVANGLLVLYLDPSDPSEAALYGRFVAGMPVDGAYLGWFPNDVTGEVAGTTINSRHGVVTFASDTFLNMSVLAGTRRSIRVPPAPPPPPLQNKVYVAFNLSDGDNMQENEHRMRQMWDDPARGAVPLSWTISPGLLDAAPGLLDWYWRTATRRDELVAGVSGLGYIRPDQLPCAVYSRFTQRSSTYLARAGLTVIHLLDASNTLPACAARAYRDDIPSLLGLLQWAGGSPTPTLLGGHSSALPYVNMYGPATSAGALVSAVQQGAAGWDGRTPRFLAVLGLAWTLTPSDFRAAMQTLERQNASYAFVRDDQLMALIRRAHGLPARHADATLLPPPLQPARHAGLSPAVTAQKIGADGTQGARDGAPGQQRPASP